MSTENCYCCDLYGVRFNSPFSLPAVYTHLTSTVCVLPGVCEEEKLSQTLQFVSQPHTDCVSVSLGTRMQFVETAQS